MKRGEQVPDDILQRIIEQGLLTHAAELFYAGFAGTQPYPAYCLHLFISSFIQSLTQRLIHSFILHVWIHLFTYLFSILFFYFLLSFDNIFLRLDYIVIAKVSRLLIYLNVEWADNPLHACFLFFVFFFHGISRNQWTKICNNKRTYINHILYLFQSQKKFLGLELKKC